MSKFEQEASNFYAKHIQASDRLDTIDQHVSAVIADAQLRGRVALEDSSPAHHQEARSLFNRSDALAKQKLIAQKKYDQNIVDAAAHKDKHLDQYIVKARSEMLTQQAGESTVVQAAEGILQSTDLDKTANPPAVE